MQGAIGPPALQRPLHWQQIPDRLRRAGFRRHVHVHVRQRLLPSLSRPPATSTACALCSYKSTYHYIPECYRSGGPHDIAGTLYHRPTKTWHVMAGCWSKGGWQHLLSKDLVSWKKVGVPTNFGGTGGLTVDAWRHNCSLCNGRWQAAFLVCD